MFTISDLHDVFTLQIIPGMIYVFQHSCAIVFFLDIFPEVLILKVIEVSKYGLRFVPIYGHYYYLKAMIPDKKTLNIFYSIKDYLCAFIIFLESCFCLKIENQVNEVGAMYPIFYNLLFVSIALEIIIMLTGYVAKYLINRDMVELFMYNDALAIFFTIIPLLGPLAYLRNAKRALETGKFVHLQYPNRDTTYFR